jgi:purine nucleosidase
MQRSLPVVLDTDIGSDVDDLLALILLAGEPGVDLLAVTTVYGDVGLRARLARRALRLLDRDDVPVHAGAALPRSGREVWWGGHEGLGVSGLGTEDVHPTGGVDALLEAGRQHSGSLIVVAIGPLTNIAEAIERDPAWATYVRRLVVMGGEFTQRIAEHNTRSDIDATRTVLASGVPSLFVGLDVTTQVRFDAEDLDVVARSGGALATLVVDQVRVWWDKIGRESCHPHDPLAVLAMLEPETFGFARGGWQPAADGAEPGALIPTLTAPAIDYATAVDAAAARESLRRRLAATIDAAA